MSRSKQSIRSLTAFIVTWAFVVLTVTGIILYIVPQGRVAYWVHWSLAGLEKEQWGWVHMLFGGIFIVSGFVHLYFNWKPFMRYLSGKVKGRLKLTPEFLSASGFTLLIFTLAANNLPPASWVIELNSWVKLSWITSAELEPPYGHAEEASLAGIAKKMDFDLDKGMEALRSQGFTFDSKRDSLDQIARANQTTPMAVYQVLQQYKLETTQAAQLQLSPEEIEAKYSGTGLGRKTLAQISQEVGLELELALARLTQAGIDASADEKAKPVADRYGRNPIDLLIIMMTH